MLLTLISLKRLCLSLAKLHLLKKYVKNIIYTEDWFDGEVIENIVTRDKLFKKYQTSKLQIDKEIYNTARNKV